MVFKWEDGFSIAVKIEDNTVTLTANREGLLSLANNLVTLAQTTTSRDHFHLDENNSLEDGSAELIIEKNND
jgi:hypothetical protein